MLVAREETIKVIIDHKDADAALKALDATAKQLQQAFGSIRIAQATQQINNQAQAAQAAARAAQANANAQAAQARATAATISIQSAQARVARDNANAQAAQSRAATAAIGTLTAQANAARAAANAQQAQTNAQTANIRQQTAQAQATAANVRVQQELVNLQTAQVRLQNAIAAGTNNQNNALRRLGQAIGTVNANQAQTVQYMTQWIRQQQNLNSAQVTATGAIHNAAGSFQTYRAAVAEAGGATHNYRVSVNTATGEVYQLDQGVRTTTVSLRDMSSILRSLRTVIGFTGIAQSLRSAFSEMKNMSDEMVIYRKVTGATAQEMEKIRASAYETAKKYGQTPSDFLAAASEMARAGYGANSVAMAELATKTQLVGDMTAEAASRFLLAVDAGYQYKGSIEELTSVLDAANEVDNNFATSIEKISEGMTLIASLGGQAGVPIEQLIAALGTMTAATQRSGAEMARALRSIFLNVLKDTTTEIEEGVTVTTENIESMTDALKKYAPEVVKAAQATGKLINPMEAIGALAKAYKEGLFTETELFGMSRDIAGQRYYNAFAALIENYDGMYQNMLATAMNATGSADREVNAMLDSWTVKFNQLKTTWTEVVNSTISENFIKGLLDGGIAALEFAGNLENLAIMAAGAYEAIRSLSTGIGNLRVGTGFGGFNLGMTILGLGVTAIGAWKASYEANIRQMQKEAQEAVNNAISQSNDYKTLEEIRNRYEEIVSDGIQAEKGELTELNTLQTQLNNLVGEQGNAIDIVNGKYDITSRKLANLSKQQLEAAKSSLIASLTSATNAFNSSDLNGFWKFGTANGEYASSGVSIDNSLYPIISQYLQNSAYLRVGGEARLGPGGIANELGLQFIKPTDSQSIIQFTKEVEDLYTLLGSTTSDGGKAINGAKSLGEEYRTMYTALGNFVNTVKEAADPVVAAQEAIDDLDKSISGIDKTTKESDKALSSVAETVVTLTGAIESATAAKNAFDDAMKNSKADAMSGYITAFQTLQDEINAGRVNSTAFYASARMLLGDAAYNATGGTSEGVMAALNRRGSSGSLSEAGKILNQTYYDESGNEIQGYGLYQLLTQTKGFRQGWLTSAEGNAYIPELTKQDIDKISAAWGGLSTELIVAFFEAFDQYDIKGEATAAAVQAKKKEEEKTQTQKAAPELPERVTEKQNELADAEEKLAASAEEAAQKVTEAAEELKTASEETEATKEVNPDISPAMESAQNWLDLLEDIEAAYSRVANMTIGGNPEVESLIADIEKLKGEITLNIKSGVSTVTSAAMAGSIASNITRLQNYAKDGKIDITVATNLIGDLKQDLIDIIGNAQTIDELEAITLELAGNDKPLDDDITAAINKKRESITLNAKADTKEADNDITKVETKKRTAYIQAQIAGTNAANRELDNIAKPRTAVIKIKTEEDGGTASGTTLTNPSGGSSSTWTYPTTGGSSPGDPLLYSILEAEGIPITKKASGTQNHPGGLSIVNDGGGAELIIDRGRAFIAGGGKPTIVSLEKGAKIFTASETRNILNRSGIPAYAKGTLPAMVDISGSVVSVDSTKNTNYTVTNSAEANFGKVSTTKPDDSKDSGSQSNGSSGGSSSKEETIKFDDLKSAIDYIINRIGEGLDEQLEILDKQIEELKLQRQSAEQQNELEEKQKAVAEAQKDLQTALSERTIRYLGEDGKWHWMADARNVQSAQESLQKAQDELSKYQEELAYDAQVNALEEQKKALQAEYKSITEAWSKIQSGVSTPTGVISEMISAIMDGGTPQEQTGATAIRDYLIGELLTGGSYSGNYNEALESIAKATAGTPIMPGDDNPSLASLIATGGGLTGDVADALKYGATGTTASMVGASGLTGTNINYNYFVNGMEIGSDSAKTMTLSEIMQKLTVYAGQ